MQKQIKSLAAASAIAISAGVPMGLTVDTSPAQAHNASCAPILRDAFRAYRKGGSVYAHGVSVRMKAKKNYHSFTMAPRYQVESGLSNRNAARNSTFLMRLARHNTRLTGQFVQVFPERGNGDEDLTTLNISNSGQVHIVLNRWRNTIQHFQSVSCVRGSKDGDFILTGTHKHSGSVKLSTFVFKYYEPVIVI